MEGVARFALAAHELLEARLLVAGEDGCGATLPSLIEGGLPVSSMRCASGELGGISFPYVFWNVRRMTPDGDAA
jgi:hypothetical protein